MDFKLPPETFYSNFRNMLLNRALATRKPEIGLMF
jgi:hypothetical protein